MFPGQDIHVGKVVEGGEARDRLGEDLLEDVDTGGLLLLEHVQRVQDALVVRLQQDTDLS